VSTWGHPEHAALGRIVLAFAELDWCADRLLAGFLGNDLIATLLVTGENMTWKLDKLSAIARKTLSDHEASQSLLAWVKASRQMTERRNGIMHSLFIPGDNEQRTKRMKASTRGGKWRAQAEPMDIADLAEVADLLEQGLPAAYDLMGQLASCPQWHGMGHKPPGPRNAGQA
jgi:hypothetical protein